MAREGDSATARGLTRAQVAEFLGITDTEVARMDGRQLHPVRSRARVWWYDVAEVRGLLLAGASGAASPAARPVADGATTAAVFALFEESKTLPQVVIATKQPAATILQLRAEYDSMVGSLLLPQPIAAELRKEVGADLRTADEVIPAVRRALEAQFEEGRAEAHDFGEILDPATGQLRRLEAPRRDDPKQVTPKEGGEP